MPSAPALFVNTRSEQLCGAALLATGIRAREHPATQGLLWGAGFVARWWCRTLWLTAVAAMLAVQLGSQVAMLDRYVVPEQRHPAAVRLGGAGRS